MKYPVLTLFISLLFVQFSFAQDYEFGEVSLEEAQMTTYAKDTLASAVYLHNYRRTYFDYQSPKGWVLKTEIHKRIKILSKEGLDYGTVKVNTFRSGGDKERVSGIKGYVYNVVDGKLKSEKLKKSGIFKTELSENWTETSMTMPGVQVGSVIELKYQIDSPYWKIDDVIIQRDIPTDHFKAKIQLPEYFTYSRLVKGDFNVNPKDYNERRNMSVSYEQSTNSALTQATKTGTLNLNEFVSEYEYNFVPALIEEPYVDNIDNYRYTITYELATVDFPNSPLKNYSTTWEEVVETINKSKYFGEQIKRKGYFKDDLQAVLAESQGELQKVANIFDFVKGRMAWNGRFGKYSRNGLKNAYKEKTGNSGEINMILLAMLKEAGIKAYPVLISTRDNGIPMFPTIEGFNSVLVAVDLVGDRVLLDASEKLSAPNILPSHDLNWFGTLINDNGTAQKISLYPESVSRISTMVQASLDDDGLVTGKLRSNYTLLEALDYREYFSDKNEEEMSEALMNQYNLSDVSELELKNVDVLTEAITESYSFEMEDAVEVLGNEIYLSPMLFLKMDKSPFTAQERNYPIDYRYPYSHREIVTLKLPEGYKVSSMPQSVKLSLPENMGTFQFSITERGDQLSINSTFTMNNAVVPAFQYDALKEFYNQRVAKENEKVVLLKE